MKTQVHTPTAHIWLDEQAKAWIDDTNIKVIEVAMEMLGYGWSAEKINEEHPGMFSMAQIHAALSYYHDHKIEFDAEIDRQCEEVDRLREASLNSPARQKLREMGYLA